MKTYDAKGNLLGDTATAPAAPPAAPAAIAAPLDLSVLLQPPYVYVLIGVVGLLVYLFEKDHHR